MTPTIPNANLDANHQLVNDANLICRNSNHELVNDANPQAKQIKVIFTKFLTSQAL